MKKTNMHKRARSLLYIGSACALVGGSARLGGQQPAAAATPPTTDAQSFVEKASREGLPTALLRAKIAEGTAQHASPSRIATVAAAYYKALGDARTLSITDTTEWEAAASALRGGVSLDALREIRSARHGTQAAMAFIVALDLIQRGVPADSVRSGLVQAIKSGATDRDLLALQTHVATSMVNGTSALAAYRTWRMPNRGPAP